jgi:hypothetical protein
MKRLLQTSEAAALTVRGRKADMRRHAASRRPTVQGLIAAADSVTVVVERAKKLAVETFLLVVLLRELLALLR